MTKFASLLCLAALVPGAAAAQTLASAPASRTVQIELRQGNQLIGSPSVTLQVGRTTAVSVDGSYSLRLRLEAAAPEGYVVRSTLYRPSVADWAPVAAPPANVTEGEPVQLRFAGNDGRPLSLAVLVR